MTLNDAKYAFEGEIDPWELEDINYTLNEMSFNVLDLQKHQKKLKYRGEFNEQSKQCIA